ncbi:MAG: phosphoribosylaminoimidazolesuccinocarboxamide synthase, partial [Elusimicrobiota bacterium]
LNDIGLSEQPSPGQVLEKPILDVSTKLETKDRYVSRKEAGEIAGLSDKELQEIKEIVIKINNMITNEAKRFGLENNDGKMEFGFDENRNIVLVDVTGTPDECRFTYNDFPVSKEIARIFYRKTSWFDKINRAKKNSSVQWKKMVNQDPPEMPEKLNKLISELYQSFCNQLTGKKWFNAGEMNQVIREIKKEIK